MALIGTMKYLTIGNQTYEIAGDELQIASASTLGGIKVGSGLSIDSTTGVLSTSITETDPVFAASAAAGITATDISNWNAKVSDDKTWNGVSLARQEISIAGDIYVPSSSVSTGNASISFSKCTATPTASKIAKYDGSAYLNSTTPSANDNSTKVATTAYVDAAIPTVPTKTSDLTNDSGFITSFTDVNVTNTAVTAATTYYLTGSTSSSTATGGLSKHAAIKAYVTANSGIGGSARIDLGNTTATTSAGGKEGIIRLYGTSATYYVELKAGAPSANRTISFPNKGGTVALTDDIPTISYPVTSVNNKTGAVSLSASDVGALPSTTAIPSKTSDLTNDSGFLTSYTETDPVFSASAAAGITSTDISNWNAKVSDDKTWNGVELTNTAENTNDLRYVPIKSGTNLSGQVTWAKAKSTPTAYAIAKYDGSSYLNSITPSANDNSTKVATTAYVDAAIPTVPTITLNGTSTTTPSFYAPTTAGTNGYFLKSNGSGAPIWAEIETTAAQIVRW